MFSLLRSLGLFLVAVILLAFLAVDVQAQHFHGRGNTFVFNGVPAPVFHARRFGFGFGLDAAYAPPVVVGPQVQMTVAPAQLQLAPAAPVQTFQAPAPVCPAPAAAVPVAPVRRFFFAAPHHW
jgi:hypothetical protein